MHHYLAMRTGCHPDHLYIDVKAVLAGALPGQDGKLTSLALRIADKIEEIAEAHNFDHGDDMTDYFHNNLYLTVTALDRPVPHKNWRKEE